MSRNIAQLILIFIFFAAAGELNAKNFQVLNVKAVGASKSQADAFRELVIIAINEIAGSHVSDNATAKIQLRIVKVGDGFSLSGEKTESSEKSFSTSIRIASENELDQGAKRLAKALISSRQEDADATVKDVTESESTAGLNRRKTINRFFVGIGPSTSHGMGSDGQPLFAYNFGLFFEREQFGPKIFMDGASSIGSADVRETHFGLGLDYYLFPRDAPPFFGVDLAYGAVQTNVKNSDGKRIELAGFSIGLEAGYAVLRTSNITIAGLINWRPVLTNVDGHIAGVTGFAVRMLFY